MVEIRARDMLAGLAGLAALAGFSMVYIYLQPRRRPRPQPTETERRPVKRTSFTREHAVMISSVIKALEKTVLDGFVTIVRVSESHEPYIGRVYRIDPIASIHMDPTRIEVVETTEDRDLADELSLSIIIERRPIIMVAVFHGKLEEPAIVRIEHKDIAPFGIATKENVRNTLRAVVSNVLKIPKSLIFTKTELQELRRTRSS